MKKIIMAFIVAASLASISGNAQTHKTFNAKHGTEMKQMLKDSLHLTDAQADSVISIREEFKNKIKSINSDTTVSVNERKEKIKPLKEEMKTRLKAILTKEEMQKMEEMQKGMRKGKMEENN